MIRFFGTYVIGLVAGLGAIQAAPLTQWSPLDLENGKGEARLSLDKNTLTLEGTAKAAKPVLKKTGAEQANLDLSAKIFIPENPANWSSAALVLFDGNNKPLPYGMLVFEPGSGFAAGFYPASMTPAPQIQPGKKHALRLQVSEGECRFKAWPDGQPEPARWQGVMTLNKGQSITGAGLRTYALKGEFQNMKLTEGTVPPVREEVLADSRSRVAFSLETGQIRSLNLEGQPVDMFRGALGGPVLLLNGKPLPLNLQKSAGKNLIFGGEQDGLALNLSCALEKGALAITVTAKNNGASPLSPGDLDLQLGIDTCMESYPSWNKKHFPTFLRNEQTHFWGYAMSPEGSVIGLFSPDMIPAWRLNYNNGGHRINGMKLALMTSEPLPERLETLSDKAGALAPGESRQWRVYLAGLTGLDKVAPAAARYCAAPFALADKYTGEPGEEITLTFYGEPDAVTLLPSSGDARPLTLKNSKSTFSLPTEPGYHKVRIQKKKNGRETTSEVILTVRKPWSWYMEKSREWAVKAKQKAGSHVEGWYGFFPAFKIRHLIPNPQLDEQLDKDFHELFPTMYDEATMQPLGPSHPGRTQNHSCAASLYMERYLITKDIGDLEKAAKLCDYVIKTQKEDGAYRSGHTHYTSVIYLGKSLMEVMLVERELAKTSPVWKERYQRHYDSVKKAMDELALNLDNIETEGEMTFEDGMISCSYTQLAAWARHFAPGNEKQKYIDAAEKLLLKHRCLAQLVQPDSRMNGGSLRFWESQYDVLWCLNFMNSPHGWSAWRLYGLFDLYRLTGKTEYLQQAMNGMGSCANLIDPVSGELRWAFMTDPQITTEVFEPNPAAPGKGQRVKRTLGETYIPMISSWWKAPYGKPVFGYNYQFGRDGEGGSCDNDVHEIFKCLAEQALTTTWLVIHKDGSSTIWNGKFKRDGDTYIVTPSEKYVSEVHVNSALPAKIHLISPQDKKYTITAGLTSLPVLNS